MAESRKVKLYIYNAYNSKGDGVTLTESRIVELEKTNDLKPNPIEEKDPTTEKITKITTVVNTTFYSLEMNLSKLEYTKKIYEPCKIVANLQVGLVKQRTDVVTQVVTIDSDGKQTINTNTDEGSYKPTNLIDNDKINLLKGAYVDLEIDNNMVAVNYYVHKVRSVYKTISGKTSLFVELTIFSRDKLMTLDKYSRAYTAKRLYTDILSEEAKKFSSVDVANHMQLLKYQETETVNNTDYEVTKRDELRIPYLVQYNESFYQFMVRCANRFGEFLYFEDGKLNLGMQPSETNYYRRDSSGAIVTKNGTNDIIDWATEPNAVQSRYYESVLSEGISVEERAYSYLTHKPDENEAYAESADNRYNIDPTSADEWTKQELKKNEYIEFGEAWGEEMKFFVADIIYKALESHTISEALTALAVEMVKKTYDCHRNNKDYNNQIDYVNIQDKKDNYLISDDQRSDDNYKQFVTYSGSGNLSNNLQNMFGKSDLSNFTDMFYQLIRKKEKEVGEQAVWLDFGNYYYPIKLGDKLHVAGKDYVAISIEGSYENSQEHLLVSAIPVYFLSDEDSTAQTATTAGDSWTTTCPFPPALPDVVIRDARPQVAFVAEILDPGNMGRIRVRYPWQDETGDPSPWIRVTLPLATTGGSVNFTPSVGDEVMVGYVHGNIEHPYAMGYLVAPFVNERWKNAIPFDQYGGLHGIQVKTGHHLKFTDGANAASLVSSLFGPFSFAKSLWPTGLVGPWPGGNETSSDLGGGFELSDRYGLYKISGSTDDRNITIESPVGTVNINAFQGISIEAPNGEIEIKGKNVSIEASNRLNLRSGENVERNLFYLQEWNKDKWKSNLGLGFLEQVKSAGMALKSEVYDNILDVSFIRCVVEWFLIPVNGTLSIKSSTFVTIEAGEGLAEVSQDSLRRGDAGATANNLRDFTIAVNTARCIRPTVKSLVDNIYKTYNKLVAKTHEFNKCTYTRGANCVIAYATVIRKGENEYNADDNDFTWTNRHLVLQNPQEVAKPNKKDGQFNPDGRFDQNAYNVEYNRYTNYLAAKKRDEKRKKERDKLVKISNNLRVASLNLKNAVEKLTTLAPQGIKPEECGASSDIIGSLELQAIVGHINTLTIPADKGIDTNKITLVNMSGQTYTNDIDYYPASSWRELGVAMSKYVIYKYLSTKNYLNINQNLFNSVGDAYDKDKWKDFVKSLKEAVDKRTRIDRMGSHKANGLFNPLAGSADDHFQWKHGFRGRILMSDNPSQTMQFNDQGALEIRFNRVSDILTLRELLKGV